MGPPINMWPYNDPRPSKRDLLQLERINNMQYSALSDFDRKSYLVKFFDNFRDVYLNFTIVLLLIAVLVSLSGVYAGPVLLSPEYMRGMYYLSIIYVSILWLRKFVCVCMHYKQIYPVNVRVYSLPPYYSEPALEYTSIWLF